MMLVRTRNGLFANEGWGGGVFNGNTAFGSVDAATPQLVPLGGLPVMTVIPPHCEDSPGFRKERDFITKGEAKLKCDYCATPEGKADDFHCGGFTTHSNCMQRVVNDYLWNWSGAVNKFCPKDGSKIPRKLVAGELCNSDIAIKNVQHMVGTDPDGIWGKESQQAYDIAKSQNGNTWCDYVPGCAGPNPFGEVCTAAEPQPVPPPPAPKPAPTPAPEPEEEEEEPVTETKSGSGMVFLIAGGLMALAAATIYYGKGNKK